MESNRILLHSASSSPQSRTFGRKDQISYYGSFVILFWLGTAGIIILTTPFLIFPQKANNNFVSMIKEASEALVSIYTIFNAALYLWKSIRRPEYQRQGWVKCRRSRVLTPSQASLLSALYLLGSGTLLRIMIDFVTDLICLSNSNV